MVFKKVLKLMDQGRMFGVGTYQRELLEALSKIIPETIAITYGTTMSTGPRLARFLSHQMPLPKQVSLAHYGSTAEYRLLAKTPFVLTIHDLFREHQRTGLMPTGKSQINLSMTCGIQRHAVHRAQHIFAVSEYTKRELIKWYGVETDHITVTPLGVNSQFCPALNSQSAKANLCERIGISPDSFLVLYAGTPDTRKQLHKVVEIVASLRRESLPAFFLYCGYDRGNVVQQMINEDGYQDLFCPLGVVPQEQLPSIFQAADVYITTSLGEGFGLPVLEAMACGTPVVSSNAGALPEVIGDAGILLHPSDTKGYLAAIHRIRRDRESYAQKGIERARLFSWENTARKTFQVYAQLLNI